MRSAREIAKGPAPDTDTGDGAARATTRFCAFILAALVAVHLVYLFELGGESLICRRRCWICRTGWRCRSPTATARLGWHSR